jgi:hypothetical protein
VSLMNSYPVVHFVTLSYGCCNAIMTRTRSAEGIRDLFVLTPGGHADHQDIPYDGTSEPDRNTWHLAGHCPPRQMTRNQAAQREADLALDTIQVVLDEGGSTVTGRAVRIGSTGVARKFVQAAGTATAADPVWVTRDGESVFAVILPAEEYHPPGSCCCKNCPWGGKHGVDGGAP